MTPSTMLLRAEKGFSALKGTLGLRPNFHQLEGRVDGHIFISVLGYHHLCWIGHRLTQSGDMRDWQTIRRLLRTHNLATTASRRAGWRAALRHCGGRWVGQCWKRNSAFTRFANGGPTLPTWPAGP